ncbi:hypothetical protein [Flavobacterium sp. I3-2]|uniref:hypothetical protein n=1 Tax=Flavobacterium sp. I3-2 TaxID=2748319 RepID=UPI0015B2E5AD|nr:hypothetical protein [Flavobacterium sp. I3-2]
MKKSIALLALSTIFMVSCKDKVVDTIETNGTDAPEIENVTPKDTTSTELTPTEAVGYETATGDELK